MFHGFRSYLIRQLHATRNCAATSASALSIGNKYICNMAALRSLTSMRVTGSNCLMISNNNPSSTSSHHFCTATAAAPTTRKARAAGAQSSVVHFDEEVRKIKEEVANAVEPLKPLNKDFSVYTGPKNELVIQTERGKHTIYEDKAKKVLVLQSYFSGYHNYAFDVEQKLWLSIKDNHDFRGLLTRDLLRHCNGCPDFK